MAAISASRRQLPAGTASLVLQGLNFRVLPAILDALNTKGEACWICTGPSSKLHLDRLILHTNATVLDAAAPVCWRVCFVLWLPVQTHVCAKLCPLQGVLERVLLHEDTDSAFAFAQEEVRRLLTGRVSLWELTMTGGL